MMIISSILLSRNHLLKSQMRLIKSFKSFKIMKKRMELFLRLLQLPTLVKIFLLRTNNWKN